MRDFPAVCPILAIVLVALSRPAAGADGLPRGCHEMPYIRHEAEEGVRGGGAVSHAAPDFDAGLTASEASNRQYIGLPVAGSYVQWTAKGHGDGVTLRFTLPDNAAGTGVSGPLEVHVNGVRVLTVYPGSYWAWTYFETTDPRNAPGARPRMRFDEIHFRLPAALEPGDELKIVKPSGDALEYGIDFVEIEPVSGALAKPAGFISVTDYGAGGTDEASDSAAFDSAWQAAKNAKTGLYIPPGKFVLDRRWNLGDTTGLAIQGAGMWHSELFFSRKAVGAGGILAGENTTGLGISHFFMNSALNERHIVAGQVSDYKAFNGAFGSGSTIHHVWITHFETGAWLADYTAPVRVTTGFDFAYNRVRYTYADGINFTQGTSSSTVRQCDFRTNGDDAMAVWTSNTAGAPQGHHNIFHNNTVEFTYRAGGAGIFGGYGHEIHHNVIADGVDSAGIRFTEDFGGYHFQSNTSIRVYENTIVGKGTSLDLWNNPVGAVEIRGAGIRSLFFEGNDILQSPRHAIRLDGGYDLHFTDTAVHGTGLDPFGPPPGAAVYESGSGGSASFVGLSLGSIESSPAVVQTNPAYQLTVLQKVAVPSVSSIVVREGGTASFTVRLDSAPSAPVSMTVTSSPGDPDLVVQAGGNLLFTPSDWASPKPVILAALEDADQVAGQATILCSAPGYGNATVTATELENDINHAPVAAPDSAVTAEGGGIEIDVLANDADVDGDAIRIASAGPAGHGGVSHDGTRISYVPAGGFAGADSFTYDLSDGRGGQATARVDVIVRDVLEPTPYEMEIRFDGYNGSEALEDFPALVRLGPSSAGFSYSSFRASDGSDLRFRDAERNELPYEVEKWDPGGDSLVWVRVPRMTAGGSIWAAWGSPAHAVRPAYATDGSVWSSGFAGVYHGSGADSSPNARHGAPVGNPTAAEGPVGQAVSFDGSGDGLRLPAAFGLFNGTSAVTVEFWFLARSIAADSTWQTSPVIFQARGERLWMLTFGDGQPGSSLGVRLNQSGWATPAAAPGLQTSRWYHFACTYSPAGSNNWKLYVDGALAGQGARNGTVTADTSLNNLIGGSDEPGTARWFNGLVDEFRISGTARSADWVRAVWANSASPATFAACQAVRETGQRYAFSSAASSGGTISGTPDGSYLSGSPVTILASALPHFHFSHWNGDVPGGSEADNPLTLTMDRNRSVTAVMEANVTTAGTPEWWLAAHGWTSGFDAAAASDADGDGQTTAQEYLAGSDPTDPASALRAGIEAAASGTLRLTWQSFPGKFYRIEQALSLGGPWSGSLGNIPADPPQNVQEVPMPGEGCLFFRVVVE